MCAVNIIEQPPLVVTKTQPPITLYLRGDFISLTMLTMKTTTTAAMTTLTNEREKQKKNRILKMFTKHSRNVDESMYKRVILFEAMNDDPFKIKFFIDA